MRTDRRVAHVLLVAMHEHRVSADRDRADVGRVVARDDLARGLDRDRGVEGGQLLDRLPAVVERDARGRFVSPRCVGERTPATPPFTVVLNWTAGLKK